MVDKPTGEIKVPAEYLWALETQDDGTIGTATRSEFRTAREILKEYDYFTR